jgi:hypothetical protein
VASLLDDVAVAVKTTGGIVPFAKGFVAGYRAAIFDLCEGLTEVSVPIANAIHRTHDHSLGLSIWSQALETYKEMR